MATAQEAVRRLTIVTSAPGADQAAASLRGVSKAMDGVTVASTSQEKATLSLDQKFASLERRYVAQVRAQQDFEKIQKQVNAAVAQNPALQDRANIILAAARDRHDQLSNSQRALATVAQDLSSRAQAAASSFGAVGSALAVMGPVGIATAAALGVMTLGFKQASDAALVLAETAGKLKDFSETTGFSVVQLQALQKAGAQVGVSAESVSRGLERFSVAMDDVKKGTGPVFESLLEINPALAQQMKQVNSLTDAWDVFAKAIKQADLEQSNKLARSVFGRSGVEITRLARANADAGGLGGLTKQLKEVDQITDAQAERWDNLGDKIAENMKAARQNIVSIFAEPVLTNLNTFSAGFLEVSRVAKEFKASDELKSVLKALYLPAPARLAASLIGIVSGNEAPVAKPAPGSDFNGRYAPSPTAQAVSMQTVQLEAQKRALSASIAEQERWSAAMGDAFTPAQRLALGIEKLKLAQMENKISAEQAAKAQANLNAQYSSSQFATYIGLLGQAASVEDQVKAKRYQINDAARQGVVLTQAQIDNQIRLTQAQALGTYQVQSATEAEKVRLQTMFMGTEAAIAYATSQDIINRKLQAGEVLKAEDIAKIRETSAAYASVKVRADSYAEAITTVSSSMSSAVTTGFADIIDGTKTVGQSFSDMTKLIVRSIEEAIIKLLIVKPLMDSITGGLGGFFGGGSTASFAGDGIGGFGPTFAAANGGTFGPGWGVVGERGPELINVHSAGVTVFPHEVSRPHLPGFADGGMLNSGGGVTRLPFGQNNSPTVNIFNAPADSTAKVSTSRGSNGELQIDVIFDAQIAKNLAKPGSASSQVLDNRKRLGSR